MILAAADIRAQSSWSERKAYTLGSWIIVIELKPFLCESSAGWRFQVSLEFKSLSTICERNSSFDTPRSKFGSVRIAA